MSRELPNIIAIGYAKNALKPGTRERARMARYAEVFGEHHIIVFTARKENLPDFQQEGKLFLYATNARTRLGMLWRAFRIGREIITKNREKHYVVSSQDPFETALVGSAVAYGNRATHHIQIHGDVFNPRSYRSSLLQRIRVAYGRYVLQRVTCIRVVSERIKNSLKLLGISEAIITVLPIYADLDQFLAVGEKRTYSSDKPTSFLYVGRYSREKNLPLLIQAFARLAEDAPEPTLTLLGAGPQKQELEELVAKLGVQDRVQFRSWTNDVHLAMSEHTIFCLSSDHEGWGMVLLEAAAAGMPVITTDVGCAGECVKSGENGWVTSVGETEPYSMAMEQYQKNPSLIAVHGRRSYEIARERALAEKVYLEKLVDSYTSC